jgi:hypothetical protein
MVTPALRSYDCIGENDFGSSGLIVKVAVQTLGQCYKTSFVRDLQIFVQS